MRTKHWNPKQKKPVILPGQKKLIRVDDRTQVEVSVSISDEEAILNYRLKHDLAPRTPIVSYPGKPGDFTREVPVGDVQDLEKYLENKVEPETE